MALESKNVFDQNGFIQQIKMTNDGVEKSLLKK
jgi:hypothetical protein